jgi:hypothetical protein
VQTIATNYSNRFRLSENLFLAIVLSICYAAVVVIFPWDVISRNGFPDFAEYILNFDYYISAGTSRVELYELSTVIQFFTHEILWNELILSLHRITGDSAVSLRIVSFFILFTSCLFLLRKVGYKYSLLFLFNPSVIDVAMSLIRNGLAWTLIVIALWGRSEIIRICLFVVSLFIHSSSIVLLILYYLTKAAAYYFKERTLLFIGLIAGVGFGLALTVLNEIVLGAIGDRRTGGEYVVGGDSFKLASIWMLLIIFQCTSGPKYIKENIFAISLLAWYHVMNPFIPGAYRIWAAILPIIALSVINLPVRKRQVFFSLYTGFLVLQYFYWSNLFNLFI